MNNRRRKTIKEIQAQLSTLAELIHQVCDEEEEALDSLPDSLQDSPRGEAMQEAIDNLESAVSCCEELDEYLTNAREP